MSETEVQPSTAADAGALPAEVTPRIVEGVMVSANVGQLGGAPKPSKALFIEKAMSDAVQACYDAGTQDVEVVRAAILKARDDAEALFEKKAAELLNELKAFE